MSLGNSTAAATCVHAARIQDLVEVLPIDLESIYSGVDHRIVAAWQAIAWRRVGRIKVRLAGYLRSQNQVTAGRNSHVRTPDIPEMVWTDVDLNVINGQARA